MLFASLDTAVNFKKVLQFGQIINNSRCRHPLLGSLQENLLLEVWLSDGPSVVIALHPLHFTTQPLPLNPAYSQATTEHRRGSRGRPAPHPTMCDFSTRELLLKDSPTGRARLLRAALQPKPLPNSLLIACSFLKCLHHRLESADHLCFPSLLCTDISQDQT